MNEIGNPPDRRGNCNERSPVARLGVERLGAGKVLGHRGEQTALDAGIEVQGMPVAGGDHAVTMWLWHARALV